MTRWMDLTATSARIGVCLGIALLIGCSDSDSTSGLNLEKSTVEEPGVTSQIEEVRPDIHKVPPGLAKGLPNGQSACTPHPSPPTVKAPNGGEKLEIGKSYKIKWEVICSHPYVDITLLRDDKFYKRIARTAFNYCGWCWTWTIPDTIPG